MQNLKFRIFLFLLISSFAARAQDPNAIQQYINTYKDLAIGEMQRTGVPAASSWHRASMKRWRALVISSRNQTTISV